MPSSSQAERYRFADLVLDFGRRRVTRDGQSLHLGKLTYEMLVVLVEVAPNVVTHDQLMQRVWGGRIATPETVAQRVKLLRTALGDDTGHPRYIEVVRGQGYRLTPPVEREPDFAPPGGLSDARPSRRRQAWLASGAILIAAAISLFVWYARNEEVAALPSPSQPSAGTAAKSIAVLPFADLSPEQNQQYFSDGLAEEILNLLAQSPELPVIARTSSFSFRGQNVDIATVAGQLKVSHVLEGSVRKAGSQVRITAQLVDAATSMHLWSQTYDRELNDIFDVQSDIAASVADALRVKLELHAMPAASGNAQAFERALRAQFFFHRRAPSDVERAQTYYLQALEFDPNYARAWAGLAGAYWIQSTEGTVPREPLLEKQRDAAQRALALDPGLAEAHIRMANYFWTTGDRSAAIEHWNRAIVLEPNNPLLLSIMAWDRADEGRTDEAIDMLRRVTAADPLSITARRNLAHLLLLTGHLEEAKAESFKGRELDPTQPAYIAALALIVEGNLDAALDLVQNALESDDRTHCLALIYYGLGRRADADAALKELIAKYGASNPFTVAEVYAFRGENDAAFVWLRKVADTQRYSRQQLMENSPFLRPLHADPRWGAWVESVS